MKIIIDCFKQIKGVGKSIGIYNLSLNLVRNLVTLQNECTNKAIRKSEIIVLGNKYNEKDFNIEGVKFVRITRYDPLNKVHCVYWELIAVSGICKKMKADRVVFPRGYCALTHPVKDIVIIHDLIPFYYNEHYPDTFGRIENAYIMHRLKETSKHCSKIITISNSSKRDIIKYCGVKESKITVIHNGCNEISPEVNKGKDDKSYIVAVTSKLPHKNAIGILRSYERYCEISDSPLDMIVIGIEDTSMYKLPDAIKRKIKCYKFIESDFEMYRIIKSGKVLIFLSLIEGFGYPPIEAMQLGVPVICANCSSLPEVVANAAILVNPTDFREVAIEMEKLLSSEEKQRELVRKGFENIKRFSWTSSVKLYWETILDKYV